MRYKMSTQYIKGDSYFISADGNIKQYPYLTENTECDVLVIGGGATGALMGYYLSLKGINTVILEKSRIAHGSTSITTSLLQYELDSNAEELKSYLSLQDIAEAYRLGIYALDEIEKFCEMNGNDFAFSRVDSLLYTAKKNEIQQIKDEYEFRKSNGFEVEFITADNNPFGFDLEAGVTGKGGAEVIDPYKFTHSLLNASVKQGLRVYENTEAVKIRYYDEYAEAETVFGYRVKCKKVIVATGYNTKMFTERNFGTKSTTFNIVSEPVENENMLLNSYVVRDNCDPYNYFRMTEDNRIMMGGEDVRFEPDIENAELCGKCYDTLEARMKNIFQKFNPVTEYKYCGAFASTQDNLGFLGKDPDNDKLWYCLGYGANGILFAVLGGVFLSELYFGKEDKALRLFRPERFDSKR